ncbi:hypothetical protein MANAM107_18450 [Actinomyces capricornis]|uniref:Uncharacterized protein n=1 Tax=Actinomyces capricornis TaxID=2755559 RepID=A0ABN6K5Z6_9ACTO|nr:hypothetical protein MANAM107_18450 [Actinomyces capricornis]
MEAEQGLSHRLRLRTGNESDPSCNRRKAKKGDQGAYRSGFFRQNHIPPALTEKHWPGPGYLGSPRS